MNKEHGMINAGDWARLLGCMKKAADGETITVGFLGGSITQGSLSSTPETCYAYLVYQWWVNTFPNANVQYINAGIGGTTSQFGVARVRDDLLKDKPDFMIVEFSVNDDNTAHFQETYEGLVRTVLKCDNDPALMLVHNICYDTGNSAEEVHAQIGKHYDLPCVSMKSTIYADVVQGVIANREITPDDLHPNDAGHKLVAEVITHFLDKVYAKMRTGEAASCIAESETGKTASCNTESETGKNASCNTESETGKIASCNTESETGKTASAIVTGNRELPAPFTANQYENSIRYQNYNSFPIVEGFEADDTPQEHITQMFRKGFTAWKKGDRITFRISGTGIAVQYRKSINKPTPIAQVVIDDQEENAVILDGNFDEDWGDCLYIETVAEHVEEKPHKVEITIIEEHEDDKVPFYLVSVIGSN